jgi:hypothetical protein
MGILGTPGEFLDQNRLAAAGLTGDENHPALARQRQVEKSIQLRQLTLSGDEQRSFNFDWFALTEEGRRSGYEIRRSSGGWRRRYELSVPNLLVQPRRFFGWLDAQFLGQEAPARFILG